MARIRSTKPEFWSDSRMSRLPALERLVFLCLWSMADDEGRIEGDALAVWRFGSFREDSREIATALEALRGLQRIRLYEVDGNPYIEVVNFTKHQKIDHAKKSKLPAYSTGSDLLSGIFANPREDSRKSAPDQGSGIRDQGSGSGIRDQGSKSVAPPASRQGARGKDGESPTAECWHGYCAAYRVRYGVDPTRNAKVNGQLAQFMQRVPIDEAPEIAAWYVRSNRGLYVSAKHPVDLLLRDAEGLRTEWLSGRVVTDTDGRNADRTQAIGNAFAGLIAEAEERERAHAE